MNAMQKHLIVHVFAFRIFIQWGLVGREPLEILRLAAGLWYTERRDLITAFYTLCRVMYTYMILVLYVYAFFFLLNDVCICYYDTYASPSLSASSSS